MGSVAFAMKWRRLANELQTVKVFESRERKSLRREQSPAKAGVLFFSRPVRIAGRGSCENEKGDILNYSKMLIQRPAMFL